MIYFPEVIMWRVAMAMTEHVISMVLSGACKAPTAIRARKLMEELCNFVDSSVTLSPTLIKKKSLLPDVEAIKQVPKCLFKHQYDYNNK